MKCNKSGSWIKGFISGLVCGEASFIVAVVRQPTCKLGYHVRTSFNLSMHTIDKDLINSVQQFFGFGCINYPKERVRVNLSSALCSFIVTANTDCRKLVKFFQENPVVGAKQQSFEIWAKCVEIVASGEHTSSEGFNKIVELRSEMNRYGRSPETKTYQFLPQNRVDDGRKLAVWTKEEEAEILRYFNNQTKRIELNKKLNRSLPSIDNKINRMRKALA